MKNPNIQLELEPILAINKAIKASQTRYISIKLRMKDLTYIRKTLTFLSNLVLVNFF